MKNPVDIDGSILGGGGQILRTALSLSALTGRAARISGIRAGRSKPGLAPQHLTCVLALADVCDADVEHAQIGSTEIVFAPRSHPRPGDYRIDVSDVTRGGSAGSVSLILQALLLPLALSGGPARLTLLGGTHVAWSPVYDFIAEVYLPALARMGVRAHPRLVAWGFYPVGRGRIAADIEPCDGVLPANLPERGELLNITGRAVACNLPSHIPVRMVNRAAKLLADLDVPTVITPERVRGNGPGAMIFLRAKYKHVTCGFSALGERGKASEVVAEEACRELVAHDETGAPVVDYLADQLLLPAALADGSSSFCTSRITTHTVTNAHVIRSFLDTRIDIDGEIDSPGEICIGGTTNRGRRA
jgi:RNA 3'-terminal phosphate cyclase (ATP)